MELLNLLLYTTAFSQLSYSGFFDFCLINMFLKYAYYYNPKNYNPTNYNQNTVDFTTFFVTFVHFALHVLSYYGYLFINNCEQYKYGKYIINNYNTLNKSYLNARYKILYNGFLTPLKYVLKKIIFSDIPKQNIENFKIIMEKNINNMKQESKGLNGIKLNTNKQIDNFLDKILLENKSKNKDNKNE